MLFVIYLHVSCFSDLYPHVSVLDLKSVDEKDRLHFYVVSPPVSLNNKHCIMLLLYTKIYGNNPANLL